MSLLNAESIQSAALAIVDEEGADKLTMRRVAARLGVEAPSLYHHVPGKDALLDRIVDALLAEVRVPGADSAPAASVDALARSLHQVLMGHPNAVRLVGARPSRTLLLLDQTDAMVDALADAGIGRDRARELLRTVIVFVVGHAEVQAASSSGAPGAAAWLTSGLAAIRGGYGLHGSVMLPDTETLELEQEGDLAREVAQDLDAAGMAPDLDAESGTVVLDTAGPQQEEATAEASASEAPTEEAPAAEAPAAEAPAAEVPSTPPVAATPPSRTATPPSRPVAPPSKPVPPPGPTPETPRRGLAGRLLRRAGHILGRDD